VIWENRKELSMAYSLSNKWAKKSL